MKFSSLELFGGLILLDVSFTLRAFLRLLLLPVFAQFIVRLVLSRLVFLARQPLVQPPVPRYLVLKTRPPPARVTDKEVVPTRIDDVLSAFAVRVRAPSEVFGNPHRSSR